jgi:hypothetical protein
MGVSVNVIDSGNLPCVGVIPLSVRTVERDLPAGLPERLGSSADTTQSL